LNPAFGVTEPKPVCLTQSGREAAYAVTDLNANKMPTEGRLFIPGFKSN